MKISDLFEAIVIGKNHTKPLKDSDTVRVYHGTSSIDFVAAALTRGLSGDVRAPRIYSYEYNNNPKGLFVTPDLKTAKEFGHYVLEFHTRVKDLESPVWPNGTFTVQGGMSGTFSDEQERKLELMRQRKRFSNSEMEYIRNSDRPELAAIFLDSGERQALFTGNINANGIRAVWTPEDVRVSTRYQAFVRMSPKEFLQKVKATPEEGSNADEASRGKVLRPRDSVDVNAIVRKLASKYMMDEKRVREILKSDPSYIKRLVWSDKQADEFLSGL